MSTGTRYIRITLTIPQARGLLALVGQGAADAREYRAWARATLGAPASEGAAYRAAGKLQAAVEARRSTRKTARRANITISNKGKKPLDGRQW
jgi:hypothetical protein